MVVYMLHYQERIGDPAVPRNSAQHYVGSYWRQSRIEDHRNGTSGVPIVAAFHAKGISFVVARTVAGDKVLERRIKKTGQHRRYCPVCTEKPQKGHWA
jgi:hypothetical protein